MSGIFVFLLITFFVCMLTKMEENRNEVKGETNFIELGFVAA